MGRGLAFQMVPEFEEDIPGGALFLEQRLADWGDIHLSAVASNNRS
ncbi:MAG TPA: hypothetical protein VMT46_09930 [Anaerolineaceae bacterium]|nr:hypothetical protein [Anaerolineaceae bacterium]